ncbi:MULTISPECIES: aldehyde dehydrogenase family protein [Saccharothrix]|uniref:aldehyde dehydrogenase family protein n=1 Tax=Saccharothrix TaxID=2071 RepID=UPI00093E7D15|nr:aldehyde dehydrogenase family protein [Saccharothrix sp. CB00851]OKI22302.1 hypothetical protein A6A25_36100 [Saccharothrix sp. CB00851]
MPPILKPGTSWPELYDRCARVAPEAFHPDRLLNHVAGKWQRVGAPGDATSPVDGSTIAGPPRLDAAQASHAVASAVEQHRAWATVPLKERKARTLAAVADLRAHRDLLALLLVWEIGKPWRLATADVDRCVEGVEWYVEQIDPMLHGRTPLHGPVSNIASWNYPMSVLMHAMLVQALAGNAVIAKAPTDGGVSCLTLATALAVRHGLPLTLVSGGGRELSPVLVGSPDIGCLSFVGGRGVGGEIVTGLDATKRHVLEQEGLNCWGVWEFGDWESLRPQLRKSFDYAKQRCTAYPRYVVQRSLFDSFLSAELLAAMNASNGALVASLSCDDEATARRLAGEVNAFKFGHSKARSRGDREEVFGGRGASWRGAFVGGSLLVHAVTEGPPGERLYGNFPSYSLYPPT